MMLGMPGRQRRSFDPNSPGAQRLLLGARMAAHPLPAPAPTDPVDIVITHECMLREYDDGELISRQPGERVTVMRAVANAIVKRGGAELAR